MTFTPTAATSYSGTVTVSANQTSGTATTSASGTGTAAAPTAPASPSPSTGATGVALTPTLTWTSTGATSYDVKFGTSNPPPTVTTGQSAASYTPTGLSAGTKYYWQIIARNAGGNATGTMWSFTTATAIITSVSTAPASGTGASQVFTLQYADSVGATDLATAWVWFNGTFASTGANSCMVYYNRASNQINLLNDAGSTYAAGTVGTASVLQNSQCSIALGSSTATLSGPTLTLKFAMTFASGFGGLKNIYMYAANAAGVNSAWQTRGTWTVSGSGLLPPTTVTASTVSPASGSGATQTFALQYGDTAGATDLATTWVWFNGTFATTAMNSCMAYYNRASNQISLLNDAGTGYTVGTVGGSGVLQNNQCSIALGSSTATLSGTTLTLNLAMTFAPGFGGVKNIYMYAANAAGVNSAWQTRGTWTVPGSGAPAPTTVTASTVSPAFGSGAAQTFALQYGDTAGATDLATAWVWFNATFGPSSSTSCLAYYDRATNKMNLLNDAATAYSSKTVGSSGTLQNSYCSIAMGSATATTSGTTLTLNLAMTFTPAFGGTKNIYLYAANAAGANSGWQTRGAWAVPGSGAPAAMTVTASTVSPASGSGATQTFALEYGDTAGATDLATAWVWFNATFAPSASNSCMAYYDRRSNRLNLLNDAGTGYSSRAVGSSGTLQNSQCSIAMGSSSTVTVSGTTLTLNLAMTFKTPFAGAKNVYIFAASASGVNSSWQPRGAWTVP